MHNKMNFLEKFRDWYIAHDIEITWFFVGFLTMAGIDDLSKHNYTGAIVDFALVALNISLRQR